MYVANHGRPPFLGQASEFVGRLFFRDESEPGRPNYTVAYFKSGGREYHVYLDTEGMKFAHAAPTDRDLTVVGTTQGPDYDPERDLKVSSWYVTAEGAGAQAVPTTFQAWAERRPYDTLLVPASGALTAQWVVVAQTTPAGREIREKACTGEPLEVSAIIGPGPAGWEGMLAAYVDSWRSLGAPAPGYVPAAGNVLTGRAGCPASSPQPTEPGVTAGEIMATTGDVPPEGPATVSKPTPTTPAWEAGAAEPAPLERAGAIPEEMLTEAYGGAAPEPARAGLGLLVGAGLILAALRRRR